MYEIKTAIVVVPQPHRSS